MAKYRADNCSSGDFSGGRRHVRKGTGTERSGNTTHGVASRFYGMALSNSSVIYDGHSLQRSITPVSEICKSLSGRLCCRVLVGIEFHSHEAGKTNVFNSG